MMKTFKDYVILLEQDPMGGMGGAPGGMPGMPPGGGMGGPPGMDPGMGGGMGGPPPMGGGMGGPPGMDPMGGGMGGPQQQPPPSQPAALTAKPKTVWEAMESLLQKTPNQPVVQQQQQQQNPRPQLSFLKGVPGM
ncbi:MAG: hypothetical protein M0R80_02855 [Proteobacteria bacterium]|jgi:hypothetical protein|nr:hypothetical protein [Pseudomonadota bacterium]